MGSYKKRIADGLLARKLESKGAILIQGPKWCGKTTTAEQAARSVLYMDSEENRGLSELDMGYILEGEAPHLIDEWQLAPKIWDAVRFEVDHREEHFGQFILTGSAVPADRSQVHHTGTGRFAWLTMRPMSLYESGESTGEVSLEALFGGGQDIKGHSDLALEDVAYMMCRGGWPMAVGMGRKAALEQARDYVDAVVESDISRVDGISRKPDMARRLMRSYARNMGQSVAIGTLAADIAGQGGSVSEKTVSSYVNALSQIFVVDDVPAWNPNLRSRSAIRTSDTRYFVDPSIAAAALRIGPDDLIRDLPTAGFFFETLCMRDLRVFAELLDGDVYHFRDRNGLECDAVLHLRNGRYGLIEIKLGGETRIAEGAAALNSLTSKIDVGKMGEPTFRMILTAVGKYAYRRKEDGILVVPIGCLRP